MERLDKISIICNNKQQLEKLQSLFNCMYIKCGNYPVLFTYVFDFTHYMSISPISDETMKDAITFENFEAINNALFISGEKEILVNKDFDINIKVDETNGNQHIFIEKKLQPGNVCIFWDDEKSLAIVSTIGDKNDIVIEPDYPFVSNSMDSDGYRLCYKHAIKCNSIEQYINFKNQKDEIINSKE